MVVTQAAAPTAVTATAGNAQATVAFTAPADTGGAPITQFRIQVRTGTTVVRTVDVPATPTTAVITGLTNGTEYNFRVRAITSFGLGVLSDASNAVTPVTLAAAPGTPVATVGNASAGLTWTAPANTGGSAITGYRVQVRTAGGVVASTVILTGTATAHHDHRPHQRHGVQLPGPRRHRRRSREHCPRRPTRSLRPPSPAPRSSGPP